MANEYLGLSLFIMLLSFFIILNSMSDFEETKAEPILSSLNMAFTAGAIEQEAPAPASQTTKAQNTNEGTTIDKIEGLFSAQVRNFKISKNRLGTEMSVTLPRAEFEIAIAAQGIDPFLEEEGSNLLAERPFLDTLVDIIKTAENGVAYRMDIILNIGENPATLRNENPGALNNWLVITGSYPEMLEAEGMPIRFVSAGLGADETDMVELTFRRYVPVRLGMNDISERRP